MITKANKDYLGMNLTYHMFWDDESEAYVVKCLELPGCMATGDTLEDAMKALDEAKIGYLEVARLEGWNLDEKYKAFCYESPDK